MTDQEFRGYSSIEGRNTIVDGKTKTTMLERIRENAYDHPTIIWHCYRKIDGSNFSICVTKSKKKTTENDFDIRFARRTDFLEEGEKFQNYDKLKEELKEKALILAKHIGNFECFYLFGEIYGTVDQNLRTTSGLTTIQGRFFYGPHVYFTVYDLRIDHHFMPRTDLMEIGKNAGFDILEPIATGTLDELLNNVGTTDAPGPWFPGHLQSTICVRHGYDPIEGNMEEGVVLVPDTPLYMGNRRVMLKVTSETEKIPSFTKKATPSKVPREKIEKLEVPENINALIDFLTNMADENRYASAVSKVGSVAKQDRIAGEMTSDIWKQFMDRGERDVFEESNSVSNEELEQFGKKIKGRLHTICLQVIREQPN